MYSQNQAQERLREYIHFTGGTKMSKKSIAARSIIFLLILTFALKIFSSLSIAMGYNANPLFNYSGYSIFQEPDNSIDVLAIGDSNVSVSYTHLTLPTNREV